MTIKPFQTRPGHTTRLSQTRPGHTTRLSQTRSGHTTRLNKTRPGPTTHLNQTRRIITILMCTLALNPVSATAPLAAPQPPCPFKVGDVVILHGTNVGVKSEYDGSLSTVIGKFPVNKYTRERQFDRCRVKPLKEGFGTIDVRFDQMISFNEDAEKEVYLQNKSGRFETWNLKKVKISNLKKGDKVLHRDGQICEIDDYNQVVDLTKNGFTYLTGYAGTHVKAHALFKCYDDDKIRGRYVIRLVLVPKRRRMAQREFSSRRDSPVMLRLLAEIQEAHERFQRKR